MDRSSQMEELDSLKNIFYNEEFQVFETPDQGDKIQAIFWAFFTLPDNYEVKYVTSLDPAEHSRLKVRHLPPIELRLTLPKDYPAKSPPEFVISCQWLDKSKISALCKQLDHIWAISEPVEIIYCWCDFLKNESLAFLGIDKELDLTYLSSKHLAFIERLQQNAIKKATLKENNGQQCRENECTSNGPTSNGPTSDTSNSLKESLSDSVDTLNDTCDRSVTLKRDKELKENYSKSHRRHPYYRAKYKFQNKNSSPRTGEKKFDKRAILNLNLKTSPIKVLENYNTEREKVEFLRSVHSCSICFTDKLGKDCTQFKDCKHVFCISCIRSYFTVRINDGTVHSIKCPEEKCTSEALPSQVKEIVSEELFAKYDSVLLNMALDTLNDIIYCPRQICQYPVSWEPEEKMASCPNCQYVFCVTCKKVYHGVEPCQYEAVNVKRLIEEYETGSAEERQKLEMRYGKKRLETLVNNSRAEAWIKENSKACPRCEAAIEKSQGCNKMLCWKCNAPFCWLCCKILNPTDPYSHFRDPDSGCANKLFHLVREFDEEEEDEEEYYDNEWEWLVDSDEEILF